MDQEYMLATIEWWLNRSRWRDETITAIKASLECPPAKYTKLVRLRLSLQRQTMTSHLRWHGTERL